MKKSFLIVLSSSFLVVLMMLGGNKLGHEASAQVTNHEASAQKSNKQVVVIICETDIVTRPPVMTVLASSSSEGAPDIPLGSECAQALGFLLNAGFEVSDVTALLGLRVHYTFQAGGRRR